MLHSEPCDSTGESPSFPFILTLFHPQPPRWLTVVLDCLIFYFSFSLCALTINKQKSEPCKWLWSHFFISNLLLLMPLPRILWVTFKHSLVTPNHWREVLASSVSSQVHCHERYCSWDRQNIPQDPGIRTFPRITQQMILSFQAPFQYQNTAPSEIAVSSMIPLSCFSLTKIIK